MLRKAFPGARVLIVSNSAGTRDDTEGKDANLLEYVTGVKVFQHSTKKPGCGPDVFKHLRNNPETRVEHPSQIAVVGDRIFTDVVMANTMGSWSIWIKDGVVENSGIVSGNNASHSFTSGAHTIPVLKDREDFTENSGPLRLQSSNTKDRLIDLLWIAISSSVS